MQMWRSISTMPSARLNDAPVGQTSTQGGLSQCWHMTGSEVVWPFDGSVMSSLRIHCGSERGRPWLVRLNSAVQAVTQASQSGVHLVLSIRMPQRTLRPPPAGFSA
jgi:hypothetical protein